MNVLQINNTTLIPESELKFSASRSSGPGGQHVNKVSTRVTLSFDVFASQHLTDEQKEWLQTKLASRLTKEGVLLIHSQDSRSQLSNKQAAVDRFVEIMHEALIKPKKRRRKRISLAAQFQRLHSKKHRGELKKNRKKITY
jgi:ribosome-associated protein